MNPNTLFQIGVGFLDRPERNRDNSNLCFRVIIGKRLPGPPVAEYRHDLNPLYPHRISVGQGPQEVQLVLPLNLSAPSVDGGDLVVGQNLIFVNIELP